jgi:hypothetical protein
LAVGVAAVSVGAVAIVAVFGRGDVAISADAGLEENEEFKRPLIAGLVGVNKEKEGRN